MHRSTLVTDLPDDIDHTEHPHTQRGETLRDIPGVILHQGDGLTTSQGLWKKANSPQYPLFFLDGDHSYASVEREINGILEVAPNPILLLHDTFLQSSESGYNIGTWTAIEETLADQPGRFRCIHSGLSLPGVTLMYSTLPTTA